MSKYTPDPKDESLKALTNIIDQTSSLGGCMEAIILYSTAAVYLYLLFKFILLVFGAACSSIE